MTGAAVSAGVVLSVSVVWAAVVVCFAVVVSLVTVSEGTCSFFLAQAAMLTAASTAIRTANMISINLCDFMRLKKMSLRTAEKYVLL